MQAAADNIPNLKERHIWLSSCRGQLRRYRQLARTERRDTSYTFVEIAAPDSTMQDEAVATPATIRVNTDVPSTQHVGYFVWDRLRSYVGVTLFSDIQASQQRQHELRQGWNVATSTVSLFLALREEDDFALAMPVSPNMAMQMCTAKSFEGLRILLGDYLFEAVSSSQSRANDGGQGTSNAITITPQSNKVFYLVLMLSFSAGCKFYEESALGFGY
jgi:hypothetical protein